MTCPATPQTPCFCNCHTILDFDDEPLKGCKDCPVYKTVAAPINSKEEK